MVATPASPFFSVVIPLFNKEDSVRFAVESVLSQSFADLELIIVDDGSTDGSLAVARSFVDPRIVIHSQKNGGVSAARNKGLDLARAEFVAFLDADDLWTPGHLLALSDLIRAHPDCGLYASGYSVVPAGGAPRPVAVATSIVERGAGLMPDYFQVATENEQPFFTSSVCVRRETALALGGFPLNERHGEDLDLWARIAVHHKIAYDPRPLATYRLDGENRAMHRAPKIRWIFRDYIDNPAVSQLTPSERYFMMEYIAKIELYNAAKNVPPANPSDYRATLHQIATKRFGRKKLILMALSFLPPALAAALIR